MDALGTRDGGYNELDKTVPFSICDFLEVDKLGCPVLTKNNPHFVGSKPLSMRSARIASGLTLEDVAKRLCTTRQSVSYWELGKYKPSEETKKKLAELYRVPIRMITYW